MQEILQPAGWPRPRGYANGIATTGRLVFVSGQIGWDERGVFSIGLAGQTQRALDNIKKVLAQAGARPEHVVRLTWYVTDRQEYIDALKAIGAAYREVMGKHYPVMSVVQVVALIEREAKVEIEATAVVPHREGD